ncbi:glycerate kinase [bacterium]|nr:glycerate kinase [bacterium]MBU3956414.1 glycerate kinase [bacterium]MBU4134635.1 glycerate kinase [bacterium]
MAEKTNPIWPAVNHADARRLTPRSCAPRIKKNKLKIVVCPDSFKGCLSSEEAAECIREGLKRSILLSDIKVLPLADGGAGTARILGGGPGGKEIIKTVTNPAGKKIKAGYFIAFSASGKTAFIDIASSSGLAWLDKKDMKPLKTSTRGTGALIKDALRRGCAQIFICLGDSATVDGGAGMLSALGVKFLDKNGNFIGDGGGALRNLKKTDSAELLKNINGVKFIVLTDVTNPLLGPSGAAAVFAPQKGAQPNEVALLEKALSNYAGVIKKDTGKDISRLSGGGAAGGAGAGAAAFLDAEIKSGIESVSEYLKLEENISSCDVVITGEGRVDEQTFSGKTAGYVTKTAAEYGKTVVVFAGEIKENIKDSKNLCFIKITPFKMDREKAIKKASVYLTRAARKLGDILGERF